MACLDDVIDILKRERLVFGNDLLSQTTQIFIRVACNAGCSPSEIAAVAIQALTRKDKERAEQAVKEAKKALQLETALRKKCDETLKNARNKILKDCIAALEKLEEEAKPEAGNGSKIS